MGAVSSRSPKRANVDEDAMRRFIVIGQKATASPDFSLLDLPATSGRLDVLLRCLRAALLVSHGLRRDTIVYLVLLGGPLAPRVLRVEGALAKYLRPDERSLAVLVKKMLAQGDEGSESGHFVEVRPGISLARGGLETVLADVGSVPMYVLEEGALDVREGLVDVHDLAIFVGDHLGFDEQARARLTALGATALGTGPISTHADDAIAVVCNELDRRSAAPR